MTEQEEEQEEEDDDDDDDEGGDGRMQTRGMSSSVSSFFLKFVVKPLPYPMDIIHVQTVSFHVENEGEGYVVVSSR